MRTIKEGDIVEVFFNSSTGMGKVSVKGRVDHMPADNGDMWFLETPYGPLAINPQGNSLECIKKLKRLRLEGVK